MPINSSCSMSYDKVDHSKQNKVHLMVSLDSPVSESHRTPVRVALVLDVSGSMNLKMTDQTKTKMSGVKKIAKKIVEQLSSKDEISIITYSNQSEIVVENCKVTNKELLNQKIDSITTLGSTNMGAGLIDGFKSIASDFNGVKRVLLLSDGLNNQGMTNDQIKDLVKNRNEYGKDIVVSTFGLGTDCDQEFMADLSKLSSGNYYFINSINDMNESFAVELGGALSCSAQNIEITIKPNVGNKITEVLNNFTVDNKNENAIIHAEDIYVGETRNVLIEMTLEEVKHPKPRKTSVCHVEVSYHDVISQKVVKCQHNVLVEFVKAEEADKEEKLSIKEQVAILNLAKSTLKAVKEANAGNFSAAQTIYNMAAEKVYKAASLGSVLCSNISNEVREVSSSWNPTVYNDVTSFSYSADAQGLFKNRCSNSKMTQAAYSNKSAEEMINKFKENKEEKEETKVKETPAPDQMSNFSNSFSKRKNRD